MTTRRRAGWRLTVGLAFIAALAAVPGSVAAGGSPDRLPDLRMKKLDEFRLQKLSDGRRLLRFSSVILNLGEGPFEVVGERECAGSGCPETMATRQKVTRADGTERPVPSEALMKYDVGDGHRHWHILKIEKYELIPISVSGGAPAVRTGNKVGFCFFDNVAHRLSLPNAPQSRQFFEYTCGVSSSTKASMGLSVGWGDLYPWDFARQWIDATGLPSGRYLVCATADPDDYYLELNDVNNSVWTEIRLTSTGMTVLREGRSSCEAQIPLAARGVNVDYAQGEAIYGSARAADQAFHGYRNGGDLANRAWARARSVALESMVTPADR